MPIIPSKPTTTFLARAVALLIVLALVNAAFRLAFLWRYADHAALQGMSGDIAQTFWLGLRFDLKVGASLALGWLMPLAALRALRPNSRWLARLEQGGLALLLYFLFLLSVIEHFFFGFYQTPFTPLVFGLFDDDTGKVLATVWQDYPVLTALAALTALTALALAAIHFLAARLNVPRRGWRRGLVNGLLVLLLVLLVRGSFTTFPLNKEDARFSSNPILNYAARNATNSLYDAWVTYRDDKESITHADEGLTAYGFNDVYQAASVIAGHPVTDLAGVRQLFWRRAAGNKEVDRPHVVFTLMESWSGNMLDFDAPPKTDLLGRLRPATHEDYWFRHFLPAQGGTHPSLEALLLNTPITPLTLGKYRQTRFETAVTRPFKRAGYETIFITGGSLNWRDLNESLRYQGFDKVYDQADIAARYGDTRKNDWGALDEYLFRFALDELNQADRAGKHVFLFLLTTTNHPPFQLPADRRVALDTAAIAAHARLPADTVAAIGQTYHYASDQLGGFMAAIKGSDLGKRTLVAAAGDHNMRYVFNYRQPRDSFNADHVAAYLYVPPALRPHQAVAVDGFFSHQDIFPTLSNLALPQGTAYFSGGNDILATRREDSYAHCWYSGVYTPEGYITGNAAHMSAFRWQDQELVAEDRPSARLAQTFRLAEARLALRDWWIRSSALGQPPGM